MGIRSSLLAVILCAYALGSVTGLQGMNSKSTPIYANDAHKEEMKTKCLADIRQILLQEDEWIKVHAAEFLLQLGYPEGVQEEFIQENQQFSTKSPYRIGIWRVLAQSEPRKAEKERWITHIKNAFLDPQGSDRLHAIETLAKLKISLQSDYPVQVEEALNSAAIPMALYSKWSTAYTDKQSLAAVKTQFIDILLSADLDDPDQAGAIRLSSYVLRFLGAPEQAQWEALATAINNHPHAPERSSLLTTLYLIRPSGVEQHSLRRIKQELNDNARKGVHVSDLMIVLAEKGTKEDLPIMQQWFDKMRDASTADYDADIHATAAFSFARLLTRTADAPEKNTLTQIAP